MDRRDAQEVEHNQQASGPSSEPSQEKGEMSWVEEDGKLYRMPYKMVKQIIFSDLDQTELKDIPHSARLQYRLLLMDSILKVKVHFHKRFIRIMYNPVGADNIKEKISREQLIEFLAKEGVHVKLDKMQDEDYDYYNKYYKYTYFSPSIREAPPYGYTREEWKALKEKRAKEQYRLEHPTALDKIRNMFFKPKAKKEFVGITMHPK